MNLGSTRTVTGMTITIGEIAERSGFSASALRYYERIGLVTPVARSDAGYRLYDDRTLARLTFIDRAKQLGCTLDDIADLVSIWDREDCGPVQQRFHTLVTANLDAARGQISELSDFSAQLLTAAEQLSGPALDGACGPESACIAVHPDGPVATAADGGRVPDAPVSCTLDRGDVPERVREWKAALSGATGRSTTPGGGLRITFGDDVDAGRLARLMAAEQRCCGFFAFSLTADRRGVALEVWAPAEASTAVAELFGRAA